MSNGTTITELYDNSIIIFDFELLSKLAHAQKGSGQNTLEETRGLRSDSPSTPATTSGLSSLALLMKKRKRPDSNGLKIGDAHYSKINETFHSDYEDELNEKLIRYKLYMELLDRRLVFTSKAPFALPTDLSIYGLTESLPNVYEFVSSNVKLGFSHNGQLLSIRNKVVSKLTSKIICSFNFSQQDLLAQELQNEISIFNISGMKSCNSIIIDGPNLLFTINTLTNEIKTVLDYRIYYGTFVNQTLVPNVTGKMKRLINRFVKPYPVSDRPEILTEDPYAPVSAQLFYNAMANNAQSRAPIEKNFDLPELETNLLRFQRKTVSWLLEKESVKYDWTSNRCTKVELIEDKLIEAIIEYLDAKEPDPQLEQQIDNEIFKVLNKLCFGWERVLYKSKVCWYNKYTVNLIERVAMYNFIVNYFSSLDKIRCPKYLPGQGLLAEEMGLGKTVEVTALTLMNPRPIEEIDEVLRIQLQAYGDLKPVIKAKTTLIIAPDSILKQWADEIVHLAPSLAITIYRGLDLYPKLNNNAGLIADYLRMFDVVFTTYSVISRELDYALYSSRNNLTRSSNKRHKPNNTTESGKESEEKIAVEEVYDKDALLQDYRSIFQLSMLSKKPKIANEKTDEEQEGTDYERALQDEILLAINHNKVPDIYSDHAYQSPLMLLQFWRVVLDEVQMVSSKVSRAFQSAALIPRFHAWGVSGTPIKKDLSDLHSVLTYLKYLPFCGEISKSSWSQLTTINDDNTNEDFIRLWLSVGLRHTKAMAHDDIKLPPQHRVLMTIPFNPVEQENYNQLLEDCLAAICLDIDGNPILDDWEPTTTVLAYMRSWLVRLRQVCCNPQIGQLNISTRRYKSKVHLYNSKFEFAVQTLKTLDNVLDDMLSSASSDIFGYERRLILNFVDMAQFLEFILCPEESNRCLMFVTKLTQIVIHRATVSIQELTSQIDAVRSEDNKFKKEEEENSKITPEVNNFNSKTHGLEELLKASKQRLRSYHLFLHKCYFLLASSFFQMYDEEYKEKIAKFKINDPEISTKVAKQLDHPYNPDSVTELLLGFIPIFEDESLAQVENQWEEEKPESPEEDPQVTKYKFWEQKIYDLAESTRLTILQASIVNVDKTVNSRITSRDFFGSSDGSFVDDGSLLLPKSTKKFFKSLPLIDIDEIGYNVVGLKEKFYFQKVSGFISQLNAQAELINEWMQTLIDILCAPLLTHDKTPNGEEYEKSIVDQEKASCYLHLLNKLLTDRTEAINGPGNSSKIVSSKKKQEQREFDIELQRVTDKEFLNWLESKRLSVKPSSKSSFQELVLEIKNIESELNTEEFMDEKSIQVELQLFAGLAERIRNTFENQKLAQVLFQKELSVNCNVVFNARIDYFKQLQQISDSVKIPTYNLDQEALDLSTILLYLSNFGRSNATTSGKMGKAISKFRYLKSLTKTSTVSNEVSQEDEDFFLCIICRSTITIGSLTLCGHKYCKECLEQWLVNHRSCPMCKTQISPSTVYNFTHYKPDLKANKVVEPSASKKKDTNLFSIYKHVDDMTIEDIQQIQLKNSYSSKVDMIVKQVLYLKSKDPKVQVVVFSQWQDLLYILATAFKASNISYLASYGTLSTEVGAGRRRSKYDSVEQFKDPSQNITCFLLNAKAQASGLTLINATHIFLCEPLVNTSLELQAISRVHRIGQTKVTTVWMFAIENTVEESIVLLSTNKRLQYLEDEKASSITNKSRSGTPVASKISNTKDRDLTKAESLALSKSGGIDTLVNKGSGDGETVSNSDLWDAFFCATATKERRTAMNLDVMSKID